MPTTDAPTIDRPVTAPVTTPTPTETPQPSDGDGDHDRFSHYVRKSGLTESYIEGREVTALCGKKWVPTRDPERYPVCPSCKEILTLLRGGGGEG